MIYYCEHPSPVGRLFLASRGEALMGLWIEGQKYFKGSIKEEFCENDSLEIFTKAKAWLNAYFAGQNPDVNALPLAPEGSPFQKAVWDILITIPYGKLTTYGAIAKQIAQSTGKSAMSAQAVGGAVGHNPISIIIPCHRVVGASGSLTGYAGGVGIKKQLLLHEGADMSNLFVPKKGTAI